MILSASDGFVLADHVSWARSPLQRMRGLIGREELKPGEALVIDRARQVHTWGMRVPIDVVFCGADWSVRHLVRAMPPRRISRWVARARYAVELPSGTLPPDLVPGSVLDVTRP